MSFGQVHLFLFSEPFHNKLSSGSSEAASKLCIYHPSPLLHSSRWNQIVCVAKRETRGLVNEAEGQGQWGGEGSQKKGFSHPHLWGIITDREGPRLRQAGRTILLWNITPNSSCALPASGGRWWAGCLVYCLIYHCWAACLREAQFKIDWKVVSVNWINTDGFPQKKIDFFPPSPKT